MREVVIVSGARTAIGESGGNLSQLTAPQLGGFAGKAAVERAGLKPEDIEEVLVGHCLQGGAKANPARQVQNEIGIPWEAPAATINQQCASSLRALEIAWHNILLGLNETALVAGIEGGNAPYYLFGARRGYRLFHANDGPWDAMFYDGLSCAIMGYFVALTAENLAERYNISREEQDELAYLSQTRAVAAIKAGKFKEEIVPIEVTGKKGEKKMVDTDEHPRPDITLEKLARLRPVFKADGTVTAGNSSGLNEGGAAAVLMSREKADAMGIKPMARILSSASYGVHPEIMGIGPVYEIPLALKRAGLEMKDVDYFEINEAFAAQWLACNRELKIDMDKVNANGSGIALGHPTGMTGIRLVISGIYELRRRGGKIGCASLCAGGGPGIAVIYELL